jgi:hypothetical protein
LRGETLLPSSPTRLNRDFCARLQVLDSPSLTRLLFEKLDAARRHRGVVVTTAESVQSLQLKYVEILHTLER